MKKRLMTLLTVFAIFVLALSVTPAAADEIVFDANWLQNQIDAAGPNSATIYIPSNIEIGGSESLIIASGQDITLKPQGGDVRITRTTQNSNPMFTVYGTLTLSGDTENHILTLDGARTDIGYGDDEYSGSLVYVDEGTFTLNMGNIMNNKALSGGGVCVVDGSKFMMNGGTITDNQAINGGGVSIDNDHDWRDIVSSSFNMNGGTISRNVAMGSVEMGSLDYIYNPSCGGGVSINTDGIFTLSNGTISKNQAVLDGGGVYVAGTMQITYSASESIITRGKFIISGGEISENIALNGDEIFVGHSAELKLSGDSNTRIGPNTTYIDKLREGDTNITIIGSFLGKVENITSYGILQGCQVIDIKEAITVSSESFTLFNKNYKLETYNGYLVTKSIVSDTHKIDDNTVTARTFEDLLNYLRVNGNRTIIVGGEIPVSSSLLYVLPEANIILKPTDTGTSRIYLTGCDDRSWTSMFIVDGGNLTIQDSGNNRLIFDGCREIFPNNDDPLFYVTNNGIFNMSGGEISGNANINGALYVEENGVFTMSNGSIVRNNGGVNLDGMFIMSGGKISENTGVGVMHAGTFIMSGGEISKNRGGVLQAHGLFTMSGGNVTNNNLNQGANIEVGGVYIMGGTFVMSGGEISGNEGIYGGGVCIAGYGDMFGTFIMSGGTVTSNSATYGDEICVAGRTNTNAVFQISNEAIVGPGTTYLFNPLNSSNGEGTYIKIIGTSFNGRVDNITGSNLGPGKYIVNTASNALSESVKDNFTLYNKSLSLVAENGWLKISDTAPTTEIFAGSGTETDPYQIITDEDLLKLAENVNNGNSYANTYFIVMQDIDLSQYDNWIPIGYKYNTPFSGIFNGSCYTIRNLTITQPGDTDASGLFGITKNAILQNLNVAAHSISGYHNAGSLVGSASGGAIQNCHVTVIESISGQYQIGGFVGDSMSLRISDCSFAGNVVVCRGEAGGGLVGFSSEINIINSSATGSVSSVTGKHIGGLIGRAQSSTEIKNCYVLSNLSAKYNVGGLIGYYIADNLSISNCYVAGCIYARTYGSGGLIGFAEGNDLKMPIKISNSYVSGIISADYSYAGGFIGYSDIDDSGSIKITNSIVACKQINSYTSAKNVGRFVGSGSGVIIDNCYACSDMTTTAHSGFSNDVGITIESSSVFGTFPNGVWSSWDTAVWKENEGDGSYQLPIFDWQTIPVSLNISDITLFTTDVGETKCSNGSGTMYDPYIITSPEEFNLIRYDLDANYILSADIDLSGYENWEPIGNLYYPFRGCLDGKGHQINNLNLHPGELNPHSSNGDCYGLFESINCATIKAIILNVTSISGSGNVGSLCGYARGGIIENCSVYITGTYELYSFNGGGLIGGTYSSSSEPLSISNCLVSGSLTAHGDTLGGLIGSAIGEDADSLSITGCYVTGNFSSQTQVWSSKVGGLIGDASKSISVSDCYVDADIDAYSSVLSSHAGGLIGEITAFSDGSSIIENCYVTGTISGVDGVGGLIATVYYVGDCEDSDSLIIRDCVSLVSEYSGTSNVNRILGYAENSIYPTFINNYALSTVLTGNSIDGIDLSPANSETQTFYENTLGWDFANVWIMDSDISRYPVFIWQSSKQPNPTVNPTSDKIDLCSGWNFISIPKTLDSSKNTAHKLFEGIDTDNYSILGYNTQTQIWERLTVDTYISPMTGYWIYSKTDDVIECVFPSTPQTPSIKTVYPGWNAVGLSAEEPTEASNALAGTKWRTVIQWNLANKKYDSPIINGGTGIYSPDHLLNLGNGYWLFIDEQGTLTGLTA
ncbi:MAG: hypothetical protein M0P07_06035 [Candidatus Methanomethylophilaceae archaeon]|nr:hypothetical protein [Candidatus Methanomethylophilaceae archaeon]